jgi:hypothetical protein
MTNPKTSKIKAVTSWVITQHLVQLPCQPLETELPANASGRRFAMILARVTYDADTQQFRLADPEIASIFHDGETCMLLVDFLPKQQPQPGSLESDLDQFLNPPPPIGHA